MPPYNINLETGRKLLKTLCPDYIDGKVEKNLLRVLARPCYNLDEPLRRAQDFLGRRGFGKKVRIKGERPERMKRPSELHTGYRTKLADYIRRNTGIGLPVDPSLPAPFYDAVADYLGL